MNNQEMDENGVAPYLIDFLEYRELFLSVGQLPESNFWNNDTHTHAIKRVVKVIREVSTINYVYNITVIIIIHSH
jgi:hypothetical protein